MLYFGLLNSIIMKNTTHHPTNKLSEVSHPLLGSSQTTSKENGQKEKRVVEETYPDYPLYPPNEDIYSNYTKEEDVDPEQPSKLKSPPIQSDLLKQYDIWKDMSGEELDVPGAELDDDQETIGNEDEENNFYSIGGENHHDLDEGND